MDSGEKSNDPEPKANGLPLSEDAVADAEPPKEGLVAWLQVLGAFCVYLNTWLVTPSGMLGRPLFTSSNEYRSFLGAC
jgi:hypothetical protein